MFHGQERAAQTDGERRFPAGEALLMKLRPCGFRMHIADDVGRYVQGTERLDRAAYQTRDVFLDGRIGMHEASIGPTGAAAARPWLLQPVH